VGLLAVRSGVKTLALDLRPPIAEIRLTRGAQGNPVDQPLLDELASAIARSTSGCTPASLSLAKLRTGLGSIAGLLNDVE